MSVYEDSRLERLIARALSAQPLMPAPADLEARVLAEIGRRAALPWWQRRFTAWPALARVAFAAACGGVALASLGATRWLLASLGTATTASQSAPLWLHVQRSGHLLVTLGRAVQSLLAAIPAGWLYSCALLAAITYVALIGVAAAAYRVLYVRTPN